MNENEKENIMIRLDDIHSKVKELDGLISNLEKSIL
jgi:tetrahydromethanopterin S-methyltransferase subunit B